MDIKGSSHLASPDTLAGARRGDFHDHGQFRLYAAKTARDHETGSPGTGGMGWGGGGMGWGWVGAGWVKG